MEVSFRPRDDFALLYFYSPNCEFCKAQNGIFDFFTEKYHWEIKYINVDYEHGLVSRFNVQTWPSTFLIYRNSKDYIPVSSGVISLDEMQEKIYRSVRLLQGEITPQEWNMYEYQKKLTPPHNALEATK